MVCYPWLVLQAGYQVLPSLPPHLQPVELLQKAAASLTKVGQPVSIVHQQCRVLKAESGCGCWYQLLASKKSRHHNLHMPCRMQFTGVNCAAGDNVYSECDLVVRKLLWLRVMKQQGADDANMALAARDTFVQVCLMGQRPDGKPGVPSVELAQEVCAPLALLPLDPSTCAFVGSHTVDYLRVASGYGVHLTGWLTHC